MNFVLLQSAEPVVEDVTTESDEEDNIVAPKNKKRRTLEFSDEEDEKAVEEQIHAHTERGFSLDL